MTSTNRTTIATRISQGLALTALAAGLAIGSAATANAESNLDQYNRCIINGGYIDDCCIKASGDPIIDPDGWTVGCWYFADGSGLENVPQEPGPTTTPPVLQNPPGQTGPSNPLIPTPRGPNSGTLAP